MFQRGLRISIIFETKITGNEIEMFFGWFKAENLKKTLKISNFVKVFRKCRNFESSGGVGVRRFQKTMPLAPFKIVWQKFEILWLRYAIKVDFWSFIRNRKDRPSHYFLLIQKTSKMLFLNILLNFRKE